MTVNRRHRGKSVSDEHEMIDIQYEIQKLEADIEFHTQKIRLIKHTLGEKNEKLSVLMEGDVFFRKMRDQFREGNKGERSES
tara:strand:+ start:134 stop:379 length:246 start_codon:yes stop_codon:yes gene_type:complete